MDSSFFLPMGYLTFAKNTSSLMNRNICLKRKEKSYDDKRTERKN